MLSRRALLSLVCLGTSACGSSYPVEPPLPPIEPAPRDVAKLTVHVHALVAPPETPQDEWEYHHMSGLTGQLRSAFQSELQAAGYTVIVDRHREADLVATIDADWPVEQPGVATLTLTDGGRTVERLSTAIRLLGTPPETRYLKNEAAQALVRAMSRSEKVAAFAKDRPSRATPQIAAPTP
jgi:hypothetical protein